ncbi:MAG: PEP-CTERM sorting domain-containing protein [Limisphaerales bacterium]
MKISIIAFISFCVSSVCYGQGTLIAGHFGSANPTTEGFSLLQVGNISLVPATSDLGFNAWSITASSPDDIGQYKQSLSSLLSANWVLSLTLRIGQPVNPGGSGIFASLVTGTEYFLLNFGASANGDPVIQAGSSQYNLNGIGDGYHNYQLMYDGNTDLASLWVDGTEWLTSIQGSANPTSASLAWGEGQHGASGSIYANWNEVALYTVPEPSPLSLIFLGSGILIYVRRIKKHSHV